MTSQKSKMGHIYLSWTSSEQILSKIREPFLVTKIKKFWTWNWIFWWKIFHFGEILFLASGPSSMPNFSPNKGSGKFSTLVENFPLPESSKKKFFYSKITWIGTFCIGDFFPINRKIFHFSDFGQNSEILFIRAYKCAKFQTDWRRWKFFH